MEKHAYDCNNSHGVGDREESLLFVKLGHQVEIKFERRHYGLTNFAKHIEHCMKYIVVQYSIQIFFSNFISPTMRQKYVHMLYCLPDGMHLCCCLE
jgi:hypothetical protein